MVASTTPATGGRRPSGAPRTLAQTHNAPGVAWAWTSRRPAAFEGLHALHAECLREWQHSVVTPGQRAILDEKKGARFAKSLRQLALAEYDSSAGRCSRASVVSLTH